MENALTIYGTFIKEIKALIYRRQYEAMKKVNAELVQLYWGNRRRNRTPTARTGLG
jgi:hypothetical protein